MAHRDERKRSKHKRSKHKRSKHKKHHKKRRKKTKHHRRKRARPSGLPSVPTLEQNQFWVMQAKIAGLEQQMLAAAKESKPEKKSRAEEVDFSTKYLRNRTDSHEGATEPEGAPGSPLRKHGDW